MAVFNNNLLAGAGAQSGTTTYTIDQSIRFNEADSPYMQKTYSGDGSRTTWSFSFWTKLGKSPPYNTTRGNFLIAYNTTSGAQEDIRIEGSNQQLQWFTHDDAASGILADLKTTQYLRDHSAWYHILCVADRTQAVESERQRMYINGQRVTNFATETYPSKDGEGHVGKSADVHYIGSRGGASQTRIDGYMAEIHYLDGYAYDPSFFGEFNNSGIWIPKEYTGSYGNNGFYLKGNDANNLGKDSSGNDNDFANGLHTFEPSESNGSLSNGNLTTSFASVTNFRGGRGFVGKSSGKWYAEVTIDNRGTSGGNGRSSVGITRAASFGSDTSTNAARDSVGAFTYSREGAKEQGTGSGVTSTSTGYDSFSNSDVIGVALNMDDGEVYFYKNGTAQDSGTAAFTGLGSNTYDLIAIGFGGFQSTVNFGATAFSYTPPTGYAAWDTGSDALLPSDQVSDSPTNNFAVLNPIDKGSNTTLANGNLEFTSSNDGGVRSSVFFNADKYYIEAIVGTYGNAFSFGISNADRSLSADAGTDLADFYGWYINPAQNWIASGSNPWNTGSNSASASLDVMQMAIDASDPSSIKLYAGINNTYYNSSGGSDGNPSSGTNPTATITGGEEWSIGFWNRDASASNILVNFGQEGTFAGNKTAGGNLDVNGIGNFFHSVPTGFKALCTKNLGS